ncbi:MAG: hypothetical protein L3J09_09705 [Flavobacteriaceae bacterium]|nr:hypothetical protein [Flavobacteriaceae bacterium]
MKNIKKYMSLTFIGAFALATFVSCEDSDKFPLPEFTNGGFVKFVTMPEFDAGADPATASFSASTESPSNNIASYDIRVLGDFDGATEDTIAFRSTTTFPFDVSFDANDMAALFGVDVSTFVENDSFEFFGVVTTNDGVVYDQTQTGCDCPDEPNPDPDNTAANGTWNGGGTNNELLSSPGLLQAFNWEVKFRDPN